MSQSLNTLRGVQDWLNSLGLERYSQKFIESGLDSLELVKHLRKRDLTKMEITASFHQDLILREANKLVTTSNSNTVRIQLKNLEEKSTQLVVPSNLTIEQLKQRIERDWLGLESRYQKLHYQGTLLAEQTTLKEHNITNGSCILVISTQPPAPVAAVFVPPDFSSPTYFFDLHPVPRSFEIPRPSQRPTFSSMNKVCQKLKDLELSDDEARSPRESSETITVQFISTMNEIQLEACPQTLTVGQLKAQLVCVAGPIDNQMIILNCRISDDDDATLASFGFNPSADKVYVVIRQQNVCSIDNMNDC